MRPIRLPLVLILCAIAGCAQTRSSQVPNPNVSSPASGGNCGLQLPSTTSVPQLPNASVTQIPNPNAAQPPGGACVTPPPPKKPPLWRRLLPWDDDDDRPKTQKEIDDDFKWRNT
ncbi:MAG TPA: hypothetical protein VND64_05555 [Pirellulales bacterium]|nr:hypothetical protein [Pirellulales bacterium]